MRITLEDGPLTTFIIRAENGASRLVQQDTDYPGVATTFGWPRPQEDSKEAIWAAYDFLYQHVGAVADDPGYF